VLVSFFISAIQAEPEEVVVTGTAFPKIESHVSAMVSVTRDNQIARWNRPLCLRAEGISAEHQETLLARFSLASQNIRLSVFNTGCNPNVLLFFSPQAAATTQQLADHFEIPLRQAGPEQVSAFRSSSAPVRWITTFDPCGFGCRLANSRISASTAPALQLMVVVVDIEQITDHRFQSVADYLALVALTNPSNQNAPSRDSILGLFSGKANPDRPTKLSILDTVFIEALYAVPMDRYAKSQQHAISSRMVTLLNEAQQ
jgi:hypothetical protein